MTVAANKAFVILDGILLHTDRIAADRPYCSSAIPHWPRHRSPREPSMQLHTLPSDFLHVMLTCFGMLQHAPSAPLRGESS